MLDGYVYKPQSAQENIYLLVGGPNHANKGIHNNKNKYENKRDGWEVPSLNKDMLFVPI